MIGNAAKGLIAGSLEDRSRGAYRSFVEDFLATHKSESEASVAPEHREEFKLFMLTHAHALQAQILCAAAYVINRHLPELSVVLDEMGRELLSPDHCSKVFIPSSEKKETANDL